MDKIKRLIKELQTYKQDINVYMEAATIEAQDTIIDINIGQMYDSGERADGSKITPEYTPKTIAIKRKKGQPTNRVTLRDTFDFQKSLWVQFYPEAFEIKAADWKTEQLKQKYGDAILGLQDENIKYLISGFYIPRLIKELKQKFGYV